MNFIRTPKKLICQFGKREKALFVDLLGLYPKIPATYARVSRSAPLAQNQGVQELLDEALAEQRAKNKAQLRSLLEEGRRLRPNETGWSLALEPAEAEWLLQVLNDIRVGSWICLGSPEKKLRLALLDQTSAAHLWAMELSGHFQMQLLHALEGGL